MNSKYHILFIVELRHDYFESAVPDFLEIVPTTETQRRILDLGMICKWGKGYCAVLARADVEKKLLITLPAATLFDFLLKPLTHQFASTTNIDVPAGKKLYFSNTVNNEAHNITYISTPVPFYSGSIEYTIGSFAKSADGKIFEALQPSNSGNPHGIDDSGFWRQRAEIPYVTEADSIVVTGNIFQMPVNAGTHFNIEIFRYNTATSVYDVVAQEPKSLTFEQSLSMVAVDLTKLSPGLYRVKVNDQEQFVFRDEEALAPDVIGVVQIVNYAVPATSYRLVDNDNILKEPSFKIYFANRSVIWRYKTRTSNVTEITDTNAAVNQRHQFSNQGANTFTSDLPIPVTQKPIDTLQLHSNVFGDINYLANPPTYPIHQIQQNGHTYYCLEQYLQY